MPTRLLTTLAAALAFACAGCGSNPLQSMQSAFTTAANNVSTAATSIAATKPTPANVAQITSNQLASLNQFAASTNLTPEQKANLQALLQQGIASDQKAGLTLQQQQDNTTKRIALLRAIYGPNGPVTNLNQ